MKILIVTKNWLGDILFEIPAIEMLRRKYPEAEIIALTHPRCREILALHPAVNRIIPFDEKNSSWLDKVKLIFQLRCEKIDQAYFFHRSRTRAFLAYCSGIPKRAGYAVKKPHFLSHAFPEPDTPLHHTDYFVHLLTLCGIEPPAKAEYSFYFSSEDGEKARRRLQEHHLNRFSCFHLGANWEPKRWPPAHFAALADQIFETWKLPIVLTGGAGDLELGEEVIRRAQKAKVVSLIGKTSLGELAAIFSRASFVVSGDSGPMHIASGVGARVLTFFGPTHPALTGPRGAGESRVIHFVPEGYSSPWYGKQFPTEGWLSQITPQQAMRAIEEAGWGPDTPKPLERERPGVSEKKGHVLLVTLSNIGDVILTTPVLMALVSRFPDCSFTVVSGPRAKGVLQGSVFIDDLVIYDKQAGLTGKIRFIETLRRKKYDAVVDLKNSAVPFLVSAKKRSPLFRPFKKISARDRHLEVLGWMGISPASSLAFDFYGEKEALWVKDKLAALGLGGRSYIAAAPVAASEIKTWPMESFAQTLSILLKETDLCVVLAGGPREAALVQPLVNLDPSRIFNLAGETNLRQFAALIAGSRLLLANDSSAAQLGFEMNHPSAVIFGPTDPKKFARETGPFRILYEKLDCVPCGKSTCRLERQACLLDLKPQRTAQACLELLAHPSFGDSNHGQKVQG